LTWVTELEQQQDNQGNLIPLWNVIQYDDNNPNSKYIVTITQAVKETCYS
jgi:hypothetical protein